MNEVELCKEMLLHSLTSKKTDRMTMSEIKSMLGMFFSYAVIKEAQKALNTQTVLDNIGHFGPIYPTKQLPLVPYCSDTSIEDRGGE
jgi:hypothetical protein